MMMYTRVLEPLIGFESRLIDYGIRRATHHFCSFSNIDCVWNVLVTSSQYIYRSIIVYTIKALLQAIFNPDFVIIYKYKEYISIALFNWRFIHAVTEFSNICACMLVIAYSVWSIDMISSVPDVRRLKTDKKCCY